MPPRYAVYFIPKSGSILAALGSSLLGRDSETGLPVRQPELPGVSRERLAELTENARHYGLHATLKAPFYLKAGISEADLLEAARRFSIRKTSITLPRLVLARLGSFFALTPGAKTPQEIRELAPLNELAAETVVFFDDLRAEPDAREMRRRRPGSLTPRQRGFLMDWGYPYVFEEYRFHITLTDHISDSGEAEALQKALTAYLRPLLHEPAVMTAIAICKAEKSARAESPRSEEDFFTLCAFGMGNCAEYG